MNLNTELSALKGVLFSGGILLMSSYPYAQNRLVPFVGFIATFASFLVVNTVKEEVGE